MSAPPMTVPGTVVTAPTPTSEPTQPPPQVRVRRMSHSTAPYRDRSYSYRPKQPPPTPQVAPNVTIISEKPATIVTTTEAAGANPATALPSTNTATQPSRERHRDTDTTLLVILAILVPAVSAYMSRGCGLQLLLNIFLCLISFGLFGVIHAIYLAVHDDPDHVKRKEERRAAKQRKKQMKQQHKDLNAGSIS